MKKIMAIVLMLATFMVSSVALAAGTAVFRDDGNYLKPQERQEVQQKMQEVADKHNIRIMGQITRKLPAGYNSARSYARTVVDETFKNEPAVFFYVDMGTRNWYLAANKHLNKPAITQDYGVDYINGGMSYLLKNKNYDKAFIHFATKVDELMSFAKEHGHAMTAADYFSMEAMVAALVFSLLFAYCVRKGLIASMSNVNPAIEASEYLIKDSFNISQRQDRYLYTHTTVVRKSSSSGGGSDGSSGGSGGGGSF